MERRHVSRWLYRFSGPLKCAECGVQSEGDAPGWRGYRTDEPATDDVPAVVFLCPYCSIREFG